MGSLEGTYDTCLHEAVRYGDIEETRMALQQGYDPNLIGVYQWSSLHEAAHNGELEILKLLLDKKGDPNRRDLLQGYTALHYAAREGHSDCLQLLVDKGGRYDVTDNDGNNSYDVATSECKLILDKLRVKDLMKLSPQDAKKQILEKSDSLDGKHPGEKGKHFEDLNTSLTSESSDSHVTEDKTRPALGYVHLTFEYHAHKTTLKIRVWQISDLLLPPPNTSMIHSVYVKSYLMPDKKKDSKRKTEEVKVESSEAHYKMSKKVDKGLSVQHVFSPSTFKFSKPLEYTNVTKEAVKEKSVQIEVCVTQKYTKRSFLIGMYHMPLKSAIKKLVREKYPLIPCMNHTIPANMKVYCASELQITNAAKVFYSNPNVRNISNSDISEISGRAVSDPDIPGLNIADKLISSVSVDVDSDSGAKADSKITIPGEMENGEILSEKSNVDHDNMRFVDMSDSEDDNPVFIDDSIYDSSEEISEYVDKFSPFKELNDEVSEV
ncbi:hypothetical protein KUTeg_002092 [Tegillarca granosa]|uniref:Uncharacterized protein n=1 Tax=Tegillarca granosa TaxID=220873 RepID=A0ABQ9FXP2_TEGGR|nr:hypothetical protein KUTeg_002092 [Tegillarca granosa]